MARGVEGFMHDALEAAADEAIQEFDVAQSEDDEVYEDDASADDGDEEAVEAADEQSEDAELEADDEEPADEAVEASAEDFDWDGNPETVPDELKPYFSKVYDTMRKGVDVWMSKKATEWQKEKQAYEARLKEVEEAQRQERQKAITPVEPVMPGENATAQDWDKYYREAARYEAWQVAEQREQLNAPASLEYKRQLEYQQDAIRRANMIESQPGYNDDIGNKMIEVAKNNPYWSALINTDDGLMALFETVKTQVESAAYKEAAAKANSAELQRKAKAVKRKVPKPKTATKKVTPARNFAEMGFEEKIDTAIDEAFSEFGS